MPRGAVAAAVGATILAAPSHCLRRSFSRPTFEAAGGQTRPPMLWLYAEEDGYYSAAWIRRYHGAFAGAGGVATFHLFPAFGTDGHRPADRPAIWGAAADDFPRRLNLPPE
jgi:hypothetical protein